MALPMTLLWLQKTPERPPSQPPAVLVLPSPAGTEKRPLLRAPQQLTITRLSAVITAGSLPTVTFTVRHGADVAQAGTLLNTTSFLCNSNTSGLEWSSFSNPVVPAGDWIWVLLSARSGTPQAFSLQLEFL